MDILSFIPADLEAIELTQEAVKDDWEHAMQEMIDNGIDVSQYEHFSFVSKDYIIVYNRDGIILDMWFIGFPHEFSDGEDINERSRIS